MLARDQVHDVACRPQATQTHSEVNIVHIVHRVDIFPLPLYKITFQKLGLWSSSGRGAKQNSNLVGLFEAGSLCY
jgi:hypothetical protein